MKKILEIIDNLIEKAKNQNSQIIILKSQLNVANNKIKEQAEIIEIQKNNIANYKEQQKTAMLAGRFETMDQTDKATLKKEISELIKEIDQGIGFLEQ